MKKHSLKKKVVRCAVIAVFGTSVMIGPALTAGAGEAWQSKFQEVCSKVDMSGSMSEKELAALIQQADELVPEIEASREPRKKVYLRRLKNCKSMFEFVIETKKK